MSAKAAVCVFFAVLLAGPGAWGGVHKDHGGGAPLPQPQIGTFRKQNLDNLGRLKVGMSGSQVSAAMGDRKDVQTYNLRDKAEIVSNPVRVETRAAKGGKSREIRYYFAYQKKADRKITVDELCPVVFEGGSLVGWGWEYYEKTIGPMPADL